MKHKLQSINRTIDRSKLFTQLSDLAISALVSLFIVLIICQTIGTEHVVNSLSFRPSVSLSAIIGDINKVTFVDNPDILPHTRFLGLTALCICIVLASIVAYSIIHSKYRSSKNNAHISEKYQDYFAAVISNIHSNLNDIYTNNNAGTGLRLTKEDISNVNNRTILLAELKGIHSLIKGNEKKRLEDIYFALGFVEELEDKFKSPEWKDRAGAIKETIQFQVKELYPYVFKLVNDSNSTVSQNAILSTIGIAEHPLSVLNEIERPLSKWEQHNILLAVKKLPKHKINQLDAVKVKNDYHQEFLQEINIYFHQNSIHSNLS